MVSALSKITKNYLKFKIIRLLNVTLLHGRDAVDALNVIP